MHRLKSKMHLLRKHASNIYLQTTEIYKENCRDIDYMLRHCVKTMRIYKKTFAFTFFSFRQFSLF